jgi:Rrf2 family protein
MLRLSKKADYALIAMKHLAGLSDTASASAREIGEQYQIPLELLAKILQRLAREGILASHQGIRGGYYLARPAGQISVANVIEAIDGPFAITACSEADDNCDQFSTCSVRDPLWQLKGRILEMLQSCSLAEIAADEEPLPATVFVGRPLLAKRAVEPVPHR